MSHSDSDSDAADQRPAQRFPSEMRLRTQGEFRRVYSEGVRRGDGTLLIVGVRNELTHARIGLSVSRKHGCAVIRNSKKRRMREAFRRTRENLPSDLDLILIPRLRPDISVDEYATSLQKLSRRIRQDLLRRESQQQTPNQRRGSESQ